MSASSMSIPRGGAGAVPNHHTDSQEYIKNLQGKKKKASFECQHCTRKFATRSHLVRHSRVHTGERRYACDYPGCEMRCSRKDNLQQHYRTHLVVNPRKANAHSSLTVDPDTHHQQHPAHDTTAIAHHDFSDVNTLTSPTEMKPIMNNNSNLVLEPPSSSHEAPINHQQQAPPPPPPNQPPPLGSSLVDPTAADGPEREWSISPPPLSSAYDYWYVHGCLPHTVRNPSISGSGSSGATSPEISNALELAPGHGPRTTTYVDSPTTYYHPHSIPHHGPPASGYSSYDNENGSMRTSFPLGTATFPSAADYQHHHHSNTSSHQRSHSYTMGGGPSYHRMSYESASASPLTPHGHHHAAVAQNQARHSYSAESYEPSGAAAAQPYSSNGSRPLAYNTATSHASYHASAGSIDGQPPQQQQQQQQQAFHPHHSHSHSADSHAGYTGSDSRPVTRHGSLGGGYSISVYPSHPHATIAYGVPVDNMPPHHHPHGQHGHAAATVATYGESPVQRHSMPVSVANSPRVSTTGGGANQQSTTSLVLPPIRYTDGEVALGGPAAAVNAVGATPYGMTHFGNGSGWDRISVSDARALPPQPGHMGGQGAGATAGTGANTSR